jgi:outer membrane receptor protein involved in Fe transport
VTAAGDVALAPGLDVGLRAESAWGRSWAFRQAYYDYFGHDETTSTHGPFDFSDPDAHSLSALVTVDATLAYSLPVGAARIQLRAEVRNLFDRKNELDRQLLWSGSDLEPLSRFYPGRVIAAAVRIVL